MREKLKEILLMARSSEAGEGEIPFEDFWSDQILTLLKEEISQKELPTSPEHMPTDKYNDMSNEQINIMIMDKKTAFEMGARTERQAILRILEGK